MIRSLLRSIATLRVPLLALGLVLPAGGALAAGGTVAEDAGQAVRFASADGVDLHGQLFPPERGVQQRGGIVFVHGPNRSRRDWAYMAQKMSRQGFTTLIFDLRGHGESLKQGDEELDREIFMDSDYAAMGLDLAAAVEFIREQPTVPADRLQLAGSDLGGSLALLHAVSDPGVRTVTLLSPGLGYDGVNIIGQAKALGDRHLLMVFSVEDSYSKKSTEVLTREASGPTYPEILYGVGHGTKMLSRDPGLEVLLMRWFLGRIFAEDGRPADEAMKPGSVDKEAPSYDVEAEKKRREEAAASSSESSIEPVGDEEEESRRWDEDE